MSSQPVPPITPITFVVILWNDVTDIVRTFGLDLVGEFF
jgi:hypothetical protein